MATAAGEPPAPPLVVRPRRENPNRGTLRGTYALEESFRQFGAGRGGVAQADGELIAGSHALETAVALGLSIREVHTDGSELLALRRTDLDLGDASTRALAYADNRTTEVGWRPDEVLLVRQLGTLDLSLGWTRDELLPLVKDAQRQLDEQAEPDREPVVKTTATITLKMPPTLYARLMDALSGCPGDSAAAQLAHLLG